MKKEYKNVSPLDLIHILPDFPSIYNIYLKIFHRDQKIREPKVSKSK